MNETPNEIVRALIIPTDGVPHTILCPQSAGTLIHEVVGGWFDCVRGDDFHGYVNDTGLLDGLPINPVASALFGRVLAGPAVVFGSTNVRGEYDGYEHHISPTVVGVARRLWEPYSIYLQAMGVRG